jgi:hypothetical protein
MDLSEFRNKDEIEGFMLERGERLKALAAESPGMSPEERVRRTEIHLPELHTDKIVLHRDANPARDTYGHKGLASSTAFTLPYTGGDEPVLRLYLAGLEIEDQPPVGILADDTLIFLSEDPQTDPSKNPRLQKRQAHLQSYLAHLRNYNEYLVSEAKRPG